MRRLIVFGISLVLALAPSAVQGQSDLLGDKDCFGTPDACVEGTYLPWTLVTSSGDPVGQDEWLNGTALRSWSHVIAPGSYSSATLVFRTSGIADVQGPYDVFVDGVVVGQMPLDGFGHEIIETFSFALDPLTLADGMVDVSFTSLSGDGWAIDYSELFYTASVPEPASVLLMASGFLGLVGVRVRKRRS